MSFSMIICNYVYSAFQLVKTSCEITMQFAEMAIDGIFAVVRAATKLIQTTLGKALEAIVAGISYAVEAMIEALSALNFKDSAMCKNMYKCNFFKEQILNKDSLISKTIYSIWDWADGDAEKNAPINLETGKPDTTLNNVKATQEALYQIVNDWETFREQLCAGLTIDVEIGAVRSLLQGFSSTINGWIDIFQKKVDYAQRLLQNYLDSLRGMKFFEVLDELKLFFDCVIDTNFCSSVDTSKSFFNHAMKVCGLVDNGLGEYGISTAMSKEISGPIESFVGTCNQVKRIVNKALRFLANPASMKGANNAFKLNDTIKGIFKFATTGKLSSIPIVSYIRHKTHEILNIWRGHHQKQASYDVIFINTKMSADRLRFGDEEYEFNGGTLTGEVFDVDPNADLSCIDDVILVNGNVYTVSEAATAMQFRKNYPERFKRLNGKYDELLEYCDDVNNFMTDMVNITDLVQKYK